MCLHSPIYTICYLAVKDHDGVIKVVVLHCGGGVELGNGRFNPMGGGAG